MQQRSPEGLPSVCQLGDHQGPIDITPGRFLVFMETKGAARRVPTVVIHPPNTQRRETWAAPRTVSQATAAASVLQGGCEALCEGHRPGVPEVSAIPLFQEGQALGRPAWGRGRPVELLAPKLAAGRSDVRRRRKADGIRFVPREDRRPWAKGLPRAELQAALTPAGRGARTPVCDPEKSVRAARVTPGLRRRVQSQQTNVAVTSAGV